MQRIFHTPEGVRDIYSQECSRKQKLQEKLHRVFHQYGFEDIETPTFEYFEVFSKEVGTIPSRDLYKFFDREGNTLVLRPDFTPSVSRACATYFDPEDGPVSLCYTGNTFINNSSYRGQMKESTQMGVEHIGDDSAAADAEILAMTVECLKAAGLTEFQVSVGQVDYYKSLLAEADLEPEMEEHLRELISQKNYFGVEELLKGQSLSESLSEAFAELPQMFGSAEVLEKAKKLTTNPEALAAVKRLEEIYEILKVYGCEKYVAFDFGMLSKFRYYTGIIFRGYTYGTGDAIGKGGRYDNLLAQFGKEASASGFTILIDDVLSALSRQNISISLKEYAYSLLLYKSEDRQNAIPLVVKLRDAGVRTELVSMTEGKTLEEYLAFGKNQGAEGILYLDGENVTVYDMASGEQETKTLQEFREEY